MDPLDLMAHDASDHWQSVTHASQDVVDMFRGYKQKGYVDLYDSVEAANTALGGKVVLSKLLLISKAKFDATTKDYSTKVRTVLDLKASGITAATELKYRTELPKVTDAVADALDHIHDVQGNEGVEFFVADVSEAFWPIPNKPEERRFFAAKVGDNIAVLKRTAQGSRSANLSWATFIGLVGRRVQSLFRTPRMRRSRTIPELLLPVVVDDPLSSIRGTESRHDLLACMLMCGWLTLGAPWPSTRPRGDHH